MMVLTAGVLFSGGANANALFGDKFYGEQSVASKAVKSEQFNVGETILFGRDPLNGWNAIHFNVASKTANTVTLIEAGYLGKNATNLPLNYLSSEFLDGFTPVEKSAILSARNASQCPVHVQAQLVIDLNKVLFRKPSNLGYRLVIEDTTPKSPTLDAAFASWNGHIKGGEEKNFAVSSNVGIDLEEHYSAIVLDSRGNIVSHEDLGHGGLISIHGPYTSPGVYTLKIFTEKEGNSTAKEAYVTDYASPYATWVSKTITLSY
ncbi:MAG: hypothetical protein LBQ41_04020 [Candidatus Ancillula sp.]|nr:hypothetical protein [Candidatus Ancillula sp.]